jgi:hypothetical protein
MRVLGIAICSCLLLVAVEGCVVPGSATGRLSIRGSLKLTTGEPLANRDIQFILPAAYGLGGLDLVLNEPEDFGHHDQVFTVTTGPHGEFSHELGDHLYHVSVWLLPPLGPFPRHPPPPFLLARDRSFPGEYYAIQTHDGQFKVFTSGGAELSLARAQVSAICSSSESGSADGESGTVGVVHLRFPAP